jgi:hypothetical protein
MFSHALHGGRRGAGGEADPGIVENDYRPILGEAVGHCRIPVVHCPAEPMAKHDGRAGCCADPAEREADAVRLDKLRHCRPVRRIRLHGLSFSS